jgi:4-aminobutyrate aminotransferase-like enzyme
MWRNTDNRLRSRWRFLVLIGVLPLPSREDYAPRLHEKARRGGLLISHEGASPFLLLPTLTIDRAVAQNGLDILEGCA